MGQILGYYEGSVEEFVADGLDQSTPSGDITFILGNGDEGDGFCTQNKVFKCGGSSSSYVPMPETFVEQGGTLDYTLSPNSSLYAFLIGSGRVSIYLQEPTSFDVVNEYTMILRTFGFGNAITLDKTIIWANDNPPVLDDSVEEILEISVKCVNAPMYDGIQYLGTWTKFSAS